MTFVQKGQRAVLFWTGSVLFSGGLLRGAVNGLQEFISCLDCRVFVEQTIDDMVGVVGIELCKIRGQDQGVVNIIVFIGYRNLINKSI